MMFKLNVEDLPRSRESKISSILLLLPNLPGAGERGRKRSLCLSEAKIGSRVELQRNRQIIPTPSVWVQVCVGSGRRGRAGRGGGEEGRAETFPFVGPQQRKQNFKHNPTQDNPTHAHTLTHKKNLQLLQFLWSRKNENDFTFDWLRSTNGTDAASDYRWRIILKQLRSVPSTTNTSLPLHVHRKYFKFLFSSCKKILTNVYLNESWSDPSAAGLFN